MLANAQGSLKIYNSTFQHMSLRAKQIISFQSGEVILTNVDFYDTYNYYHYDNWENTNIENNADGSSDSNYSVHAVIASVKTELSDPRC